MCTTRNSANLHDETTVCDQAEHALFRAVVGQLQYIIGVRLDLLFVTMSYKLASSTLGDLTRAKEALRYLKGIRHLNLCLTTLAMRPNVLSKQLKNITGYSDADWTGDPAMRKNTSCTLCYVDGFHLTS